jgi:hypothetical protein
MPTSREDPLTPLWGRERAISRLKGEGTGANRQVGATSVIGTRRLAHLRCLIVIRSGDKYWDGVKQDDEYFQCSDRPD